MFNEMVNPAANTVGKKLGELVGNAVGASPVNENSPAGGGPVDFMTSLAQREERLRQLEVDYNVKAIQLRDAQQRLWQDRMEVWAPRLRWGLTCSAITALGLTILYFLKGRKCG